jgi:hypothetical protein
LQWISGCWCSVQSSFFNILNGVQQGGVLSPIFFTICVNELNHTLTSCNVGCYISNSLCNHMFHFDGICIVLLCPSVKGLQHYISICHSYSVTHQIIFNPTKSFCAWFLPQKFKYCVCPYPSILKMRLLPGNLLTYYI